MYIYCIYSTFFSPNQKCDRSSYPCHLLDIGQWWNTLNLYLSSYSLSVLSLSCCPFSLSVHPLPIPFLTSFFFFHCPFLLSLLHNSFLSLAVLSLCGFFNFHLHLNTLFFDIYKYWCWYHDVWIKINKEVLSLCSSLYHYID